MRPTPKLLTLAAVVVLATSTPALPQATPGQLFLVKNNSQAQLTCATRAESSNWSDWFRLNAGNEWSLREPGGGARYFFCRAPADPIVYRLVPGERYSFLREGPGGPINLRRITPDTR